MLGMLVYRTCVDFIVSVDRIGCLSLVSRVLVSQELNMPRAF